MLDPALLRNQTAALAERLAARGYVLDTASLEALESERKAIQVRTQELQNLRNTRSKAIGQAKAKGEDTSALMAESLPASASSSMPALIPAVIA